MKAHLFTSDYGPQQVLLLRQPETQAWYIDEVLLKRFSNLDQQAFTEQTNDASYYRVVAPDKEIDAWFIETLDVYRTLGADHPFSKWLYQEEMQFLPSRLEAIEADNAVLIRVRSDVTTLSRHLSMYSKKGTSAHRKDASALYSIPFDTIEKTRQQIVSRLIRLKNIGIVSHNSNIVREADALVKEAEKFGRFKPHKKERTL